MPSSYQSVGKSAVTLMHEPCSEGEICVKGNIVLPYFEALSRNQLKIQSNPALKPF